MEHEFIDLLGVEVPLTTELLLREELLLELVLDFLEVFGLFFEFGVLLHEDVHLEA